MAVLIVFYSCAGENYFEGAYRRVRVGNTEKAANMLHELTGGELLESNRRSPIRTITAPASPKPTRMLSAIVSESS